MKGLYFDVEKGHVDYDVLRGSTDYKDYLKEAAKLNQFDLSSLRGNEAKKAFWINLYNVLIIHGVIALDIRSSVKEAFYFFGRIKYKVGGYVFSANDIEHGILRANASNPQTGFKAFKKSDPRLRYSVRQADPRIHCALVCASASCPPINFYDEKTINQQLDISTRSFMNRKGAFVKNNTLFLSEIFQWYHDDFGHIDQVLEFIFKYVNKETVKEIQSIKIDSRIKYVPYDWELNKSLSKL